MSKWSKGDFSTGLIPVDIDGKYFAGKPVALGSFSSDDGDGGDDAGLKNDFNFTFECRNSVNQLSTLIGLKISSV